MSSYGTLGKYLKDTIHYHWLLNHRDCPDDFNDRLAAHHARFEKVREQGFAFMSRGEDDIVMHDNVAFVSEQKIDGKYHARISAQCDRYRDGRCVHKEPVEIDLVSHASLQKINDKEIYAIMPLSKAGALGIIYHSDHTLNSLLTRIDSIQMWVGPEIQARNEAASLQAGTQKVALRTVRTRI